ncbi:MAG: DUF294 nucleotidyltransferase-like domain-containing protein [Arenibacterium sp.]
MPLPTSSTQFLASVHPYNSLTDAELSDIAKQCEAQRIEPGTLIFDVGDTVSHLYIIADGEVEITDETGEQLSILGPRNSFGERALLRDEAARRSALTTSVTELIVVPASTFFALIGDHPVVAKFFDRRRPHHRDRKDLATRPVEQLMTRTPITCTPETSIKDAAAQMQDARVSSICVIGETGICGLVTVRDMNNRVVAQGTDPSAPVADIMTVAPLALGPKALVSDVLHLMVERGVGHVLIVDGSDLVGIVTQTDLTRAQAMSSAELVRRVAQATDTIAMSRATAEIPALLAQLVETGNRHEVITRLITDIADTVTRRLLALAETELGPPPVPYLWLACGSQGRQEQTGVSDQDNCLILSDDMTENDRSYFESLARFVSDGLNACGYVYCPGEMMATNPRWCQPLATWRSYFQNWIAKPNPEAQMLASVMFDLRPIGGDFSLFADLQKSTLDHASRNSIFTAHMIANSLKHHPPLGLLRGLATIRSGEHRNRLDLKHNGVVPVVDLGRIYSLQGRLKPVNTRARLEAAIEASVVSKTGGEDLLDAYDLIAEVRLQHQAEEVRAGKKPSNYLDPSALSDFERSHLRDAFVVVKTMQAAVGSGKGTLG